MRRIIIIITHFFAPYCALRLSIPFRIGVTGEWYTPPPENPYVTGYDIPRFKTPIGTTILDHNLTEVTKYVSLS